MERIAALIDKLQELKTENAALGDIAYYTQLLYAELMCAKGNAERGRLDGRKKVAVIMPGYQSQEVSEMTELKKGSGGDRNPARKEEAVVAAAAGETREAEAEPVSSAQPAAVGGEERYRQEEKGNSFPAEPVPRRREMPSHGLSPANARELNEVIAERERKPSLNERLKTGKTELGARLNGSVPLNDLTKAIDINEKFLFINELFRGDRDMYDRSVKTINGCNSLEDAEYWIERELKIKLGWQEKDDAVQQFYHLIRRRFQAA